MGRCPTKGAKGGRLADPQAHDAHRWGLHPNMTKTPPAAPTRRLATAAIGTFTLSGAAPPRRGTPRDLVVGATTPARATLAPMVNR